MKSLGPGLIAGGIAAVIGTLVWAALGYFGGFELGWIAMGIGAAVGYGVGRYSSGVTGDVRGLIAVVLAVGSILAGKYIYVQLIVDKNYQRAFATISKESFDLQGAWLTYIDSHASQAIEEGRTLRWPEGMTYEDADEEHEYPPEIVAEASKEWKALSPSNQEEFRALWEWHTREDWKTQLEQIRSDVVQQGFKDTFSRIDIVFGVMAIIAAYSVARRDDLL